MRRSARPAAPAVIENGDRWNERWEAAEDQKPRRQFQLVRSQNRTVRDWIRDDLAAMTQEHCAHSSRYTVEPESVRHFRPKSDPRFLDLAYAWENLFFCCGGCQSHKLEQWDDSLINPDAPDYTFERYFRFEFTTGEIKPNPKASQSDQHAARTTIEIYGLDSPQRRRWRRLEAERWRESRNLPLDLFAYRDFIA
ncbi:MAG: retron system putative HNH endonuclease [Planctomycetaceae bacterium]